MNHGPVDLGGFSRGMAVQKVLKPFTVLDSSYLPNDQRLFCSDAGTTPTAVSIHNGVASPVVEGKRVEFGKNLHEVTLANNEDSEVKITVNVLQNNFLVYTGHSVPLTIGATEYAANQFISDLQKFNDQTTHTLTFVIPAHAQIVLQFAAALTQEFIDAITTQQVYLLAAPIQIQRPGAPDTTIVAAYLADIGDDDATDGILKMLDTVETKTTTLDIQTMTGLGVSLLGFSDEAKANQFSVKPVGTAP